MQGQGQPKDFVDRDCGILCVSVPSILERTNSFFHSEEERKFKCEQCGRDYRHAGSLANHRKTHEVGTFQCHICSTKLSNALSLKSHLRNHTSRKKHACTECGKAFRLATQLVTHKKVHRNKDSGIIKDFTLSRSRSRADLEDHELLHMDDVDLDIIPDLQPDMKLNIVPVHGIENGFSSDPISNSIPKTDLVLDDDERDRPFKCDLCDKTYRHHGSLINHKKTHKKGLYECAVCFKQLSNLAALNSHERIHGKRNRSLSQASKSLQGNDIQDHSTDVRPQNSNADLPFCHLCQVSFANYEDFQDHVILHNSSSVTFDLPTNLPDDQNVSYNATISHSPETPYSPSTDTAALPPLLCKGMDYDQTKVAVESGRVFRPNNLDNSLTKGQSVTKPLDNIEPENLVQSTTNIKEEVVESRVERRSCQRRFKCNLCEKSYRHAGSLINHKRSHQTGIFKCSICYKNYPHLAALKSHLRIHRARSTLSTVSDWLSSEPLTHENHQDAFTLQEDSVCSILGLDQELTDAIPDETEVEGVAEINATEQFDHSFPNQHLPQIEHSVERHMCADCGKTFTDIAGIKSHVCPLLMQQYHAVTNTDDTKHQVFVEGSGDNNDFVAEFFSQENFHVSKISADCEIDEEGNHDDEDGEMYQCSLCGDHYTGMNNLRIHLQGHGQTHGSSSASGSSVVSSTEFKRDVSIDTQQTGCNLIICSTCGQSFATNQDLKAQQLLHSNKEINPAEQLESITQNEIKPKVELGSVICGKCGVGFSDHYQLGTHNCSGQDGQMEEKRVVKPRLKRIFHCEVYLQHLENEGERQYKCDVCGRSYRHAGSLLNHKKSHKIGVFRCFVCQKRFYNLLALKNHQRTHFDVKKHRCTECGKAFKIYKQLLNHQRVHQENKAKIEDLNKQLQTLMQMSGNAADSGIQTLLLNKKRIGRRLKHRQTSNSDQSSPEQKDQTGDPSDPRPYVCDQCGRSYRHAGSLVNHKNSHKTGEYYCALCNNTYSNQLAMKNHLRIHSAIKRYRCQDCGKAFRGNRQLLNHRCSTKTRSGKIKRKVKGLKQENVLKCKFCRLTFPDKELLEGHHCSDNMDTSSVLSETEDGHSSTIEKEERPFKCNICNRSYRHAGSLLNHKNTHKTGHFTCTFCAKPFSNPMALRNHTRIHTQKKKYVCPTCGKAFRLSSILYNHQKIHARGVTHYSCQTCGKSFQGKSGLKRHRCFRNGNPNSTINQDGTEKCYTCDQCGRSYRHAGSLLNHKKTHSADLLHCTLCLKTFTELLELERHSQMARHCCPDCGKTFCEFAHLQSHMEVHSKGLSYYCNTCQQNFPNLASFQQHQELHGSLQREPHNEQELQVQGWDSLEQQMGIPSPPKVDSTFTRVHGYTELQDSSDGFGHEEKSHVCEHCGRTYRHAGSLLNHKNSHKTGSFFCSVCQKEFSNLMALKNHRRIHTEPKRYQCLECGKAFRVSTQLICHRRIHTKEKPFSCLLCDKSFSSKSNLRHHQKMHQSSQETFEPSFMDENAFMGLDVDAFL